MLVGVGGFIGVLLAVNVLIVAILVVRGGEFAPRDVGDTFEKAAEVARYADERLEAAATGERLPEPPRILADQWSLQASLIATLISQGALFAIVGIASKQSFRGLVEALGLNRFNWTEMWFPAAMMAAAYMATVLWSVAAHQVGISWLEPQSTVPWEITRSDLTLSIAAVVTVVGAPLSEELFFRGLVFSGLLKWGFWPAATASGLMFSAVHFDPGSIVPFFMISLVLSWVYHRRGSLWDAIVMHMLFNLASIAMFVWLSR